MFAFSYPSVSGNDKVGPAMHYGLVVGAFELSQSNVVASPCCIIANSVDKLTVRTILRGLKYFREFDLLRFPLRQCRNKGFCWLVDFLVRSVEVEAAFVLALL